MKDFDRFQHYRDRHPPWIKLYATVLSDPKFLQLAEAAQAQLMKLWVLASQFGNPLPNNPKLLAGKIGATGRFHLNALIASGFLVPCEHGASTALAEGEQDARPSVRVAGEKENREQRESTETTSSASLDLIGLLGGTDSAKQEVATFLGGIPDPTRRLSWLRNLTTSLQGIGAPPITPAVMLMALADFNMADRERSPYSGAVFRAFVDRAARPKLERTDSAGQRRSSGDDAARSAVTSIRALVQRNGQRSFIPKSDVEALGPEILAAYNAVGGADRFLQTEVGQLDWLVKAFAEAMRAPGVTHAA